ncbi:sensor histidine kinase [Lysobacter humi (ex Lee et al. 2017)]
MTTAPSARRFWIANVAVWALYGLLSIGMGRVFGGALSSGIVIVSVALSASLLVISGAIRAVALRQRWLERDGGAIAVRLLASVAVGAALVQVAVAAITIPSVRLGLIAFPAYTGYGVGQVLGYWINTVIVLGLWTGAWSGWRILRRARTSELAALRAESERRALELESLRARLNPHFVFNALNNLRALILEDPERARELVTRLSGTLRHALEHSQRDWTTLREECAVVDDYLAVEAVHYETRLRPLIDVPADVLDARLPPMALQLLVENAIKHGISRTPGGGVLALAARRKGATLVVDVRNPGRLEAAGEGTGVGHAFLRHRLQQAGGRFSIAQDGADVVARMEIPQ